MAEQPAPALPKMDLKMLVFPAVLLLQKKFVDLTVPENVDLVRQVLFTTIAVAVGIYAIIYQRIQSRSEENAKKIWVPPKPQPTMPFSAPPPPPSPSDYVETTYFQHEVALLKETATQMATSCGIALFMSFKFNIHVSSMAQVLSIPLGLWESPLFKKYILGMAASYNELLEAPVSEGTQTEGDARVTEISEEEYRKEKEREAASKGKGKGKKSPTAAKAESTEETTSTDPHDID